MIYLPNVRSSIPLLAIRPVGSDISSSGDDVVEGPVVCLLVVEYVALRADCTNRGLEADVM